jgi:hypothetical protein
MDKDLNTSIPDVKLDTDKTNHNLSFPIEGKTYWPLVLKGVLFSSLIILIVIGATFQSSDIKIDNYADYFIIGAAAFIVFEYLLLRRLIIPRGTNYGRYKLYESYVEFYPLTSLGFSTLRQSNHVSIAKFKGISLSCMSNQYGTACGVILVHPDQGLDIPVATFSSEKEAKDYANALSDIIKLDIIKYPAKKRKKRSV